MNNSKFTVYLLGFVICILLPICCVVYSTPTSVSTHYPTITLYENSLLSYALSNMLCSPAELQLLGTLAVPYRLWATTRATSLGIWYCTSVPLVFLVNRFLLVIDVIFLIYTSLFWATIAPTFALLVIFLQARYSKLAENEENHIRHPSIFAGSTIHNLHFSGYTINNTPRAPTNTR